jgi:RNA polymerase sigma factor (sigma-70 family)
VTAEPASQSADASAVDLDCLRGGLRILCLRALGDADAAEEAVQETIARAVDALRAERLADQTKLAAYVASIARHVCSHVQRDEKRTVSLDAPAAIPSLATAHDPLDALIAETERNRLRTAFEALPTKDQRLLRLCYYEDRSPSEVAAMLGEPAERVRKRKSRALDRLRQAFLGHAGEDKGTESQRNEGRDRA